MIQPGVYRGLSNADYHGGPGDSKSTLDIIRRCPAELHALRLGDVKREPTDAQAFGTAFHTLQLEPEQFADSYALPFEPPAGALATVDDLKGALEGAQVEFKKSLNKGALAGLVREHVPGAVILDDAKAAHAEANAGREIMTADRWAQLHHMRDAVAAHPMASRLLSAPGEAELSAYWMEPIVDPATGEQVRGDDGEPAELPMRCRPDYWRHDGILVDVKTTAPGGASVEDFARAVWRFRYYVQHPLYMHGAGIAMAASAGPEFADFAPVRDFLFVAVETDARVVAGVAKGVAVYQLDADAIALGETHASEDLFTLWNCYARGAWPGYSGRIQPLSLPGYAFTRVD